MTFILRQAGIPDWQVQGLIEDYVHYRRGRQQHFRSASRMT
jgi:hypothetical protein